MHRLVAALLLLTLSVTTHAQPAFNTPAPARTPSAAEATSTVSDLRWERRIVLVLTPSLEDPRYLTQAGELLPHVDALTERRVRVITALPGSPDRARLNFAADDFTTLLLGLDGGIKLARRDLMTIDLLVKEIDSMSMRQSEMRGQVRARAAGAAATPLAADEVRNLLNLNPEPVSGGWYDEVYRSELRWAAPSPDDSSAFPGGRAGASTITYLFDGPDKHHRLQSHRADEIYHFLTGDPIEVLLLPPTGEARVITMGNDLKAGHTLQLVLPAGSAYTSRLRPGGTHGWAVIGATIVPGWQVEDVIRPDPAALATRFPQHAEWITVASADPAATAKN